MFHTGLRGILVEVIRKIIGKRNRYTDPKKNNHQELEKDFSRLFIRAGSGYP